MSSTSPVRLQSGDALIAVDVQNDFLPGGGLATDYCVLSTVKDALAEGVEVLLLADAIRAVDVNPGDGARAQTEMRELGARPIRYEDLAP
jgi:nicotinamidase-related amidase